MSVIYQTTQTDAIFRVQATPLVLTQNTAAPPSCQWSTQLNVDELGGYEPLLISNLYTVGAGPAVLSVNNDGRIAGFQFQVAPSAPGIFADQNGNNVAPYASAAQGGVAILYATGVGALTPALETGYLPPFGSVISPVLPVSVTVGNVPAFINFIAPAIYYPGAEQVSIQIPSTVPAGMEPVVITVNGVASNPVNINVLAGASSGSGAR